LKDPFIQKNIQNSPVSLVRKGNTIISISSDVISTLIKDGVETIGKTKLGILQSEIGTHSIRSGAAMAMYMAGLPIISIMLIGRWSSTAFLKSNWKQVQELSHGISSKLLEVQSFKHIQNPSTTNPMESIVGNLYSFLMG
jgi:hypothetical protein